MSNVFIHAVVEPRCGPVLVVGEDVGDRWDVAWALQEAGVAAEQLSSAAQARDRVAHGRFAGIVLTDPAADSHALADDLAGRIAADAVTGEVPFLLVAPRATTPSAVVARVQSLLRVGQASWSSDPR